MTFWPLAIVIHVIWNNWHKKGKMKYNWVLTNWVIVNWLKCFNFHGHSKRQFMVCSHQKAKQIICVSKFHLMSMQIFHFNFEITTIVLEAAVIQMSEDFTEVCVCGDEWWYESKHNGFCGSSLYNFHITEIGVISMVDSWNDKKLTWTSHADKPRLLSGANDAN